VIALWEAERAELPQWRSFPALRWDPWTGGAVAVMGILSRPDPGDPELIAWDWLLAHDYLFNLGPATPAALATLQLESVTPAGILDLVAFRQVVGDLPLQRALEIVLADDGSVVAMQGALLDPARFQSSWSVSGSSAIAIALGQFEEPAATPAFAVPTWMKKGGDALGLWMVNVPAWMEKPPDWRGGWAAWVDASTGTLIHKVSTTALGDDGVWEGRLLQGGGPSGGCTWPGGCGTVADVELPDSATLASPPLCQPAWGSGDWLAVFDGDQDDGLHASTWSPFPYPFPRYEPVAASACVPGSAGIDLPYFARTPLVEDCRNGVDDDGNGRVDCLDGNCAGFPGCSGLGETGTDCSDPAGNDEDNDGLANCDDPGCEGAAGCVETDATARFSTTAPVRLRSFVEDYLVAYGGVGVANLQGGDRLALVVERPRYEDGGVLPSIVGPNRSFTRGNNPWLRSEPAYDGSPIPYDERWTIVLSRNGNQVDHDVDGGRSAGILFHEATHWWLRALGGNLGRAINALGAPAQAAGPADDAVAASRVAASVDEGLAYYTASSYLSWLSGAVSPGPGPLGQDLVRYNEFRDTINFTATHWYPWDPTPPLDEQPYLRYYLTWDKVEPCYQQNPDECQDFAAYAGPQFRITSAKNAEFLLIEDCISTANPITTTITPPATPPGIWWTGIDMKGVLEDTLNAQSFCASTQGGPFQDVWFEVDWFEFDTDEPSEHQGFEITCVGCQALEFELPGNLADTLGWDRTAPDHAYVVADLQADGSFLTLADQAWPTSGSGNPDCTDATAGSFTPAWTGWDDENSEDDNCRIESSIYFLGDLLTQALWDGREVTDDPFQWEEIVLSSAQILRDCSIAELQAGPEPDCPEVMGDFAMFLVWIEWLLGNYDEGDDLALIMESRGLMGGIWGN
jgi:hypothetical protein